MVLNEFKLKDGHSTKHLRTPEEQKQVEEGSASPEVISKYPYMELDQHYKNIIKALNYQGNEVVAWGISKTDMKGANEEVIIKIIQPSLFHDRPSEYADMLVYTIDEMGNFKNIRTLFAIANNIVANKASKIGQPWDKEAKAALIKTPTSTDTAYYFISKNKLGKKRLSQLDSDDIIVNKAKGVKEVESQDKETVEENLDKVEENQLDSINDLIDGLYELRKNSIMVEGEYGKGNLIFKAIRNKGLLDKLKEKRIELMSKDMSVEMEED